MTDKFRGFGRNACMVAAFTIGTAAFAADLTPRFITRSYEDVLGRAPTRVEYNMWFSFIEAGHPRMQFAAVLTATVEYKHRLVESWYQQYLHRDATAFEQNFASQMMMNGVSEKQVRATIVGSDEYFQKAGGTNDGFIKQLYNDLLGRSPSPAEIAGIIAIMNQLPNPRTQVAALVENSVEFDQREVTAIYQKFLRRNPNTTELSHATQMFLMGVPEELLIDQIMASEEYLELANR